MNLFQASTELSKCWCAKSKCRMNLHGASIQEHFCELELRGYHACYREKEYSISWYFELWDPLASHLASQPAQAGPGLVQSRIRSLRAPQSTKNGYGDKCCAMREGAWKRVQSKRHKCRQPCSNHGELHVQFLSWQGHLSHNHKEHGTDWRANTSCVSPTKHGNRLCKASKRAGWGRSPYLVANTVTTRLVTSHVVEHPSMQKASWGDLKTRISFTVQLLYSTGIHMMFNVPKESFCAQWQKCSEDRTATEQATSHRRRNQPRREGAVTESENCQERKKQQKTWKVHEKTERYWRQQRKLHLQWKTSKTKTQKENGCRKATNATRQNKTKKASDMSWWRHT